MTYRAIAADGDGTLIRGGHMAQTTVNALGGFRDSGRKIILVTGETLEELKDFPQLDLFDLVVAENGGILYTPRIYQIRQLAKSPSRALLSVLRAHGVAPLKVGLTIVSTKAHHERTVTAILRHSDLEWYAIRNRHDLVILNSKMNKASGLRAALKTLGLQAREVAAIGDAEIDLPLFGCCGLGVAVANALPALKKHAQFVSRHGYGKGVVDLSAHLLGNHRTQTKHSRRH